MSISTYPRLATDRPRRTLIACTIDDDRCYAQIATAAAQARRGDAMARGAAIASLPDADVDLAGDYVMHHLKGVLAEHEAAAGKLAGVAMMRVAREPSPDDYDADFGLNDTGAV